MCVWITNSILFEHIFWELHQLTKSNFKQVSEDFVWSWSELTNLMVSRSIELFVFQALGFKTFRKDQIISVKRTIYRITYDDIRITRSCPVDTRNLCVRKSSQKRALTKDLIGPNSGYIKLKHVIRKDQIRNK